MTSKSDTDRLLDMAERVHLGLVRDGIIICEPGCCEGCSECLGLGLGCHRVPSARLLAEVQRLIDERTGEGGRR